MKKHIKKILLATLIGTQLMSSIRTVGCIIDNNATTIYTSLQNELTLSLEGCKRTEVKSTSLLDNIGNSYHRPLYSIDYIRLVSFGITLLIFMRTVVEKGDELYQ